MVGGPQFTSLSSPSLPKPPESGIGFLAGGFAEYKLSPLVSIRTGINFDRRSFSAAFQSAFLNFDTVTSYKSYFGYDLQYNVDYITLPLSILYSKKAGKFGIILEGTFYYSIFLSANSKGYTNVYIHQDDLQYIDTEKYPDLKIGDNRTDLNGKTDYYLVKEPINSYDLGLNLYLGGSYYVSEKVNVSLLPGFASSFGHFLEDPRYDERWTRIFIIKTGIKYYLK